MESPWNRLESQWRPYGTPMVSPGIPRKPQRNPSENYHGIPMAFPQNPDVLQMNAARRTMAWRRDPAAKGRFESRPISNPGAYDQMSTLIFSDFIFFSNTALC